jgi:hypothetical protein
MKALDFEGGMGVMSMHPLLRAEPSSLQLAIDAGGGVLVGPAANDHQNSHKEEDHLGHGSLIATRVIDAENDHEESEGGSRKTGNHVGRKQVDWQDQADGAGYFKQRNDGDELIAHAREVKAGTLGMHDGVPSVSKDFAETGEQEQARHQNLRKPKDCAHG